MALNLWALACAEVLEAQLKVSLSAVIIQPASVSHVRFLSPHFPAAEIQEFLDDSEQRVQFGSMIMAISFSIQGA